MKQSWKQSWRYRIFGELGDGTRVILHSSDDTYPTEPLARLHAGRMLGLFVEQDDNGRPDGYVDLEVAGYGVWLGRTDWMIANVAPIDPDSYDEDNDTELERLTP